MKTKPLSDVTNNFNLIPFSTLRKLSNESSKPFNKKLSNSKNSKPKNNNNNNCSNALFTAASNSCSSTSDTSIGSSNLNHITTPAVAAEFATPSRRVAPPPTPPLGDGGSEVVYNRRQTDIKAKRAREVISTPVNSCPLEKTGVKRKPITVPASRSILLEKTVDKGKGIAIPSLPFGSNPLEKIKEKDKATAVPSNRPISPKNIKDKGKAIAETSDDPPSETRNNKGKAVLIPLSCSPDKTEDKGKFVAMQSNGLPRPKTEEKRKKELAVFSCPPLPRKKNTCKRSNEAGEVEPPKSWTDPHRKKRKRRCIRPEADPKFSLPRDFVERQIAYFKEVDEFELPEEEVSCDELDT